MKRAFVVIFMALLAACSVLPKREPVTIYELRTSTADVPGAWPSVNWSLIVARPLASQALDDERISVRPHNGEVQVYKGAVWTDNINDIVQAALIRRLEDSGKILAISRAGTGARGKYQLALEVREFSAVYGTQGSTPEAVVEIRAKLLVTGSGEVIAAKTFRQAQPAASEEIGTVVDAFSQSLARITDEVAGWTLTSGQAYETAKH